jgi:hypothetical protein
MTAKNISSKTNDVPLPEALPYNLQKALSDLATYSRKIFSLKFGSLLLAALLVSWLAVFASDRLWNTPVWARLALTFCGWGGALAFAWMIRWTAFNRSASRKWLARQVRIRFGGPGDRLLGVIELTENRNEKDSSYSESLYEAALKRVEKEVSGLPLDQTFNRKPARQSALGASFFGLIILACFLTYPDLSQNASWRWAIPWSDIERNTLTRLSNVPDKLYAAKGETTVLRLTLSKDTKSTPSEIRLTGPNDLLVQASRKGNHYEFLIPGQEKSKDLQLKAGDFRATIHLISLARPSIVECIAKVTYPDYLGLPSYQSESMARSVSFPEGSTVVLQGKTDRGISMMNAFGPTRSLDAEFTTNTFMIPLKDMTQDEEIAISFMDLYGLETNNEHTVRLLALEDSPPQADFKNLAPESTILLLETITLSIIAKDDLGLAQTRLKMKAKRGTDLLFDTTLYKQAESENNVTQAGFSFPFDPTFFTLQDGDIAEFTAQAVDRLPERELTTSRTVRFLVVGPEKHADIIRARMEAIMARTSEIAREQESLLMETIALEEEVEASEESIDSKTERKISKLAEMQKTNARNLKTNAEAGMDILEEAARNPTFEPEAIKDFGKTLEKMKDVASSKMNPASSKMQEAQASPPASASQSLAEAEELERQALNELQEILSDGSEQLDRLEARNLAQRLRKIESTEKDLTQGMLAILPNSIGENPEKLSPKLSEKKVEMEAIQLEAHVETGEIQKEISRFHERTGKPAYGEVSEMMEQEKAESGLLAVSKKIDRNIAFEALDELEVWEEKFKKWADLLEEQNSQGGAGQGQGQGEGKDLTEQILALLKIRDNQGEIIAKTKVVDSGNFLAKKEKWTDTLKDQQQELMLDLTDVQIEIAEEGLNPLFDDAHTEMYESAAGLENGDAGEMTQGSQSEAKDIVTDLINVLLESASSGQSSGQGQSMTGMQFLMQQMAQSGKGKAAAMTPGNSGGGSSQGGSTDKVPGETGGEASNLSTGSRKTGKSGGVSQPPPPEFKKVMESYFRNIEE